MWLIDPWGSIACTQWKKKVMQVAIESQASPSLQGKSSANSVGKGAKNRLLVNLKPPSFLLDLRPAWRFWKFQLHANFALTDCSPIIWVSQYQEMRVKENKNDQDARNFVPVCLTMADSSATVVFFLLLVLAFYIAPLLILLILYTFIIRQLMPDPSNTSDSYHTRAKKHVITMLLSVVISFFICLSPYRILIFYIVIAPAEQIAAIDRDTFFAFLNFSRIMFYLHSAIDPILYNLMSSKFKKGFLELCKIKKCAKRGLRSNMTGTRKIDSSEQEENFVWYFLM